MDAVRSVHVRPVHVHVDEVSSDESAADLGALREVTATVALGELHPDEVETRVRSLRRSLNEGCFLAARFSFWYRP